MTHHTTPQLDIACATSNDPTLRADAMSLAEQLGIDVIDPEAQTLPRFLLTVTTERLELRTPHEPRTRPIYVDLLKHDTTSPAGRSKKQPLAKAIGLSNTPAGQCHVLDATAGFGQDAWLLANFGCRVTAIERSPIVAALLRDGLRRAAKTHPRITARIDLFTADTHDWLAKHSNQPNTGQEVIEPDVIYIDPIFPQSGSSALNRRPMRVLRELVGADPDAHDLLQAARRAARRRVVVKRPTHAEPLAKNPTTTHHAGRAVRYDVYATGVTERAPSKPD